MTAFQYAEERGWIRSESTPHHQFKPEIMPKSVTQQDDPDVHNISEFMPRTGDKDKGWYVVYRGLRPGVYGTWSVGGYKFWSSFPPD